MHLELNDLSIRDTYRWMVDLITPRPIAWVSTCSNEERLNLAPFSFFNGVGANPPTIVFCPANRRDGTRKDTLKNIEQSGQFVVNLVTPQVIEAMNITAAEYPPDADEFQLASLQSEASTHVRPPRVRESLVAMECEMVQTIHLGSGPGGANLVIGRLLSIHVDDGLLDAEGQLIAAKLETIGRMGGAGYVRTTDRFEMPRPPRP